VFEKSTKAIIICSESPGADVAAGDPSPGTDVAAGDPSPGADVAAGDPSPGADVAAGDPSPGADVAAGTPVPVQMWQRQSRCGCRRVRVVVGVLTSRMMYALRRPLPDAGVGCAPGDS
jgi:hypothetical protein